MSTHVSFHDSLDRCLKDPEFKAEWDRLLEVYQKIRCKIDERINEEQIENSECYDETDVPRGHAEMSKYWEE